MKHLNPRQGITTHLRCQFAVEQRWCETPKSPPGDYNQGSRGPSERPPGSVKHLNPRQGITTNLRIFAPILRQFRVKHLNPRQGITTKRENDRLSDTVVLRCETPKSPPGDYNLIGNGDSIRMRIAVLCETPKSPPGDYNLTNGVMANTCPHWSLV